MIDQATLQTYLAILFGFVFIPGPAVLRWQGKVVGGVYCALGMRLALQEK